MAAETIIESFCERCGTRYTFEPVRKRESKLVGIGKSLGILLDTPGSNVATRDPFHGTFHFCLECRQYTCPTCWNEGAGFCLGCVPLPEAPDNAALDAAEAEASLEAVSFIDHALAEHDALSTPDAWPDADLPRHLPDADGAVAAMEPALIEDDSWSLTFEPATTAVGLAAWDALEADATLDVELVAEAEVEPEFDVELVAEAELVAAAEAVTPAEPEAELVAELVDEAEAEAVALAEPETDLVAELEAEAVTLAEPEAELVAEPEAELEAEAATLAEPEAEAVALAEPDAELVAEAKAEPEVEAVTLAEPEIEADAEAVTMAEPDAKLVVAEAEAEAVTLAELEAELVAEAEAVALAEPDAELVAEAEAEAEPEAVTLAEPEAELVAEAVTMAEPVAEAAPLAAVAARADDDTEADWADLFRRPPVEDEPLADDWSAMAPALGPDIAPAPVAMPASAPVVVPSAPVAPPTAPPTTWQITAPVDSEQRSTTWPPLGPVFRPAPPAAPTPSLPHPSVLAPRPANPGVLSRAHGQAATSTSLPNGVRPCINCELPLSATARFCRRCGRPQG